MIKANLYVNFYQDKNPARQTELVSCFVKNVLNPEIDTVSTFISKNDISALTRLMDESISDDCIHKIKVIIFEDRPSYYDYFKATQEHPDCINIISNLDIVIDEDSIIKLKSFDFNNKCLALTRWDYIDSDMDESKATFYNHADSQDTWIVKGAFKLIDGVNHFGLGICGCDNVIAYKLSEVYDVVNPSLDIKTYHYHLSNIRNYTDRVGMPVFRLEPPYRLLQPTNL